MSDIFKPRADGGYELIPMNVQHVIDFVGTVETGLSDLVLLGNILSKILQTRGESAASIDAKVAAIETAADVAEASKLAAEAVPATVHDVVTAVETIASPVVDAVKAP